MQDAIFKGNRYAERRSIHKQLKICANWRVSAPQFDGDDEQD
jgi:hypothetical protein